MIAYKRPRTDLSALVHRDAHVMQAERELTRLIRGLIVEAAQAGDVRGDVSADEPAAFCLHALTAASDMSSKTATQRLVAVTLAGLRAKG